MPTSVDEKSGHFILCNTPPPSSSLPTPDTQSTQHSNQFVADKIVFTVVMNAYSC